MTRKSRRHVGLPIPRHLTDSCRAAPSAPIWLEVGTRSKFRVAIRTREIYRSANGDRWLLASDPDTGRVFVRHEPNLPSGGQVAELRLEPFSSRPVTGQRSKNSRA